MQNQASSTPPPAPDSARRLSIEAEASLMGRGRGRQLLGLIVGAIVMVAIAVVVTQHIGRGDSYNEASSAAADIGRDFAAFSACVLPGSRQSELSLETMQTAFEKLGDRLGKTYAETLRLCAPQLQALSTGVRALEVPPPLAPKRTVLVEAVASLTTANANYLGYLTRSSGDYDQVAAMPLVERFAIALEGYRSADSDLRRELRAPR